MAGDVHLAHRGALRDCQVKSCLRIKSLVGLSAPENNQLLAEVVEVLKEVIASAFPNKKEHPRMFAAWERVEQLLRKLGKDSTGAES